MNLFLFLLVLLVFQTGSSSWDLPNQCIPESPINHLVKGTWACTCESLELLQGDQGMKSIITMAVPGRLGNRMFVFALMLAFKRVYGLRAYLHSDVLEDVNHYFPRATQIPSIENNFCMPFDKWSILYPQAKELNSSALFYGKTILFWPKLRLMDSVVNDKLKLLDLLKEVEPELRKTFVFKKDVQYYVRKTVRNAIDTYKEMILKTRKKKLKNIKKMNITLVGVHIRKRDADRDMVNRYNLPKLSPSYFLEAIHMYRQKYKHVIFLIVSDEMKWVYDNLMPRKGSAFLYPAGHGHVNCRTSVSVDLGLMAACDHTILSYGTFSFWSGWLSGGHRILPNHVYDVSYMGDPFENNIDSFRLPDYGTYGMSNDQKISLGLSSFGDIKDII